MIPRVTTLTSAGVLTMSDREQPTNGEQYGPCAVCGSTGFAAFGEFLCRDHATLKSALRVKEANE